MNKAQSNDVVALRQQVLDLQARLGRLHGGDVNTLCRAYDTLAQHIDTLKLETKAVRDAAEGLEGNEACTAQHGMEIAVEALGTLWIAHLLGWWTTSTLREGGGRSARVIMLAGAAFAGARLVTRGGRRLRSLLLRNPRHVDQLAKRLATLEQRVDALVALTAEHPLPARRPSGLPGPPMPAGTAQGPPGALQPEVPMPSAPPLPDDPVPAAEQSGDFLQ